MILKNTFDVQFNFSIDLKAYRKSGTQDPGPWGGNLMWDPRVGPAFLATQHNPYPLIYKPHFPEKILHLTQ